LLQEAFSLLLVVKQDITVTSIGDTKNRTVEELSAGSSERTVVTRVVMDGGLGKHGKVFDLRLSQVRTVGGDEDHLGLSLSEGLDSVLVTHDGLSGLHDQLKPTVHGVLLLLLHSQKTQK
jgi:hypothetical protein